MDALQNATLPITVIATPVVEVTGSVQHLCVGSTTSLTPMSGGTWQSSNTAVATVTNAWYSNSNQCRNSKFFTFTTNEGCVSAPTETITVDDSGNITISGESLLCEGETTTLTASSGGGTWSHQAIRLNCNNKFKWSSDSDSSWIRDSLLMIIIQEHVLLILHLV